jgi:type VI secretion system lysozyme-like protein
MKRSPEKAPRMRLSLMELLWNPRKDDIDQPPPPLVPYLRGRQDTLALLGASICRNLDWVLNSRCRILHDPGTYSQPSENHDELGVLGESLLVYGVRDFGGSRADARSEYERLKQEIRELVTLFEPRLQDVEVEIVDAYGQKVDRPERSMVGTLHFQIRALMIAEPERVRTSFRVEGNPVSGGYKVKEGN